jgi:hypothetical protein
MTGIVLMVRSCLDRRPPTNAGVMDSRGFHMADRCKQSNLLFTDHPRSAKSVKTS